LLFVIRECHPNAQEVANAKPKHLGLARQAVENPRNNARKNTLRSLGPSISMTWVARSQRCGFLNSEGITLAFQSVPGSQRINPPSRLEPIPKALNTVLAFVSSRKQLATSFNTIRASVENLLKRYAQAEVSRPFNKAAFDFKATRPRKCRGAQVSLRFVWL
jgi:hypothetical protein